MEQNNAFNEEQWIKTVFLISDIQGWLQETEKRLFYQLPVSCKKKLLRHNYYLSCPALAHILERHYYKVSRHPNSGKFTIPVADILNHIREAAQAETTPVAGSVYVQRTTETATAIGYDKHNQPSSIITVITDTGGRIITAFPGKL